MSINTLANAAAARRPDIGPESAPPNNVQEIAAAATTNPDSGTDAAPQPTSVNTALNVLFGYIPTEIVTLYVAVAAALQPPSAPTGGAAVPAAAAGVGTVSPDAQWIAFWCFVAATPLAVWVVYATKLRGAGKPLPTSYGAWPVWEMVAASLSFLAWAFALPNTPFRDFGWYSPALASLAVLFASTILAFVAPLFQSPLATE